MDYSVYDWKNATVEDYVAMCYPKANQDKNIHTEDIEALAPFLKKEQPKVILEIGAAYGTSSKLFAAISKEFDGYTYSLEPCPQKAWYENIKEYALQNYIELIPKASPWVDWEKRPLIDFLFIDGWHNFRTVIVDYFYWQRYVKDKGFIAFHDSEHDAVKRAIIEIKKSEYLEFVCKSNSRVGLEIYRKVKDKRGSTVFFGPWVGEFGFEVGWWQGWCRKLSHSYDHIIVSTKPGNEGLYKDFASEIIPHNLTGEPICGFAKNLKGSFDFPNVTKVYVPPEKKFIPSEEQEFIVFGEKNSNPEFDILIHVNEHRRKQYNAWVDLLQAFKGKKIACFGKKSGDYPDDLLEGTIDLRDLPLEELAGYLNGAKVVVGPSCGVMHYASFCKAKIVAWGDNGKYTFTQSIRERFEKILNPFNSPVIVLDQWGWLPPANEVINAIGKFL